MSRQVPSACLWDVTADPPPDRRGAPPADADVAIVGAGYTGLWTALSLVERDPGLRVVVLERERVGFGASGRNGGWCSAILPIGLDELARRHGREAAIAMQRAMFDTVGIVGDFAATSSVGDFAATSSVGDFAATSSVGDFAAAYAGDTLYHRGGTIMLARSESQRGRASGLVATMRSLGFGEDDARILDAAEAVEICNAAGTVAAAFTPHCAAIHPRRLVAAIADAAQAAGVTIVEGVEVVDVEPGAVVTTGGRVRAEVIALATEAFSAALPGRRREMLPVYSLMIGSAPLSDDQWKAIGLADRTTFTDARRTVIYGQRTADGRLAFGGRGAPYHYGSRIEPAFDRNERVRRHLEQTVAELFPQVRDIAWEHHWGGPLGIPRDWHPHVRFDRATGLASAGGYAGDGVSTANLAGRTLADLICGRDTELTRLPWVGHRSRRWEPEPLRWIGVRLAALAAHRADDAESAGRRSAPAWDRLFRTLT